MWAIVAVDVRMLPEILVRFNVTPDNDCSEPVVDVPKAYGVPKGVPLLRHVRVEVSVIHVNTTSAPGHTSFSTGLCLKVTV